MFPKKEAVPIQVFRTIVGNISEPYTNSDKKQMDIPNLPRSQKVMYVILYSNGIKIRGNNEAAVKKCDVITVFLRPILKGN
jgi:hypothetical protein